MYRMADQHKFELQDEQYDDPYHHFISINPQNPRIHKMLQWGLEYYGNASFALELAEKEKFMSAAEVGCGDGAITLELARRHPNIPIEGYDLSERAIHFAQSYAMGMRNLQFYAQDFATSSKQYDVILCIETLEHIPDEEVDSFLKTSSAHLTEHGRLVLTVPSTNLKMRQKHYRHYTIDILAAQTAPYFTMVESYYTHRPQSLGYKLIRFLLMNRFFILEYAPLRRWLFAQYRKHYRVADQKTGLHVVGVFKKK